MKSRKDENSDNFRDLQAVETVVQLSRTVIERRQAGKRQELLKTLQTADAHVQNLRQQLDNFHTCRAQQIEADQTAIAREEANRLQLQAAMELIDDLKAKIEQHVNPNSSEDFSRLKSTLAQQEQLLTLAAADESGRARLSAFEATLDRKDKLLTDKSAELDRIRKAESHAMAAVARHQEVIARVTADNLMLMLRAKSAETRADAAGAERDRLANAAAERRDPWLSHVRDDVEKQMSDALQRVADAELSAHTAKQDCEGSATAAAEAVSAANSQLAVARTAQTNAESRQRELEISLDRLQAEHDAGTVFREAQSERLCTAIVESKALSATICNLKEEMKQCKAAAADAEQQKRAMADRAASAAEEAVAATATAQQALAAADAQATANLQLMARKTDVEWQLIEALSSSKKVHLSRRHDQLPCSQTDNMCRANLLQAIEASAIDAP